MQIGYVIILICVGLALAGVSLIVTKLFLLIVLGGVFLGIAIFLLLGLINVQEQERLAVEFFGKYLVTFKPGLQWLLLGVMKVRARIFIWEQQITLFSGQQAEIVLRDGNVIPKDANVFVKLKSPDKRYRSKDGENLSGTYRAIYKTPTWRKFIEDRVENALRSHFGKYFVDDVVVEGKGGFNLADEREGVGLPNGELGPIREDFEIWGWELLRITVTQFALPSAVAKSRADIQIQKKEAEAAKYRAERKAEEIGGAVIQMLCKITGMKRAEEIEKSLREDPEEFVKKYQVLWEKSWDAVYRDMAISGKAYLDARTDNSLLDLISFWKRLSGKEGKEGTDGKREKDGR